MQETETEVVSYPKKKHHFESKNNDNNININKCVIMFPFLQRKLTFSMKMYALCAFKTFHYRKLD